MLLTGKVVAGWMNLPPAVAHVEVVDEAGKLSIGSSFHLGRGLFATARHVVQGKIIRALGRSDVSLRTRISDEGKVTQSTTYPAFHYQGPFVVHNHPDERVDVAVIRLATDKIGNTPVSDLQPVVQLAKYASIISEGEMIMSEAIVLGYPPISCSRAPSLVAVRGEISAVIDNYIDNRRHFVVSGMARGGFSGGPIFLLNYSIGGPVTGAKLDECGSIIGVVGQALVKTTTSDGPMPEELGFMAAVSIDTVWETLRHHGLS